MAWYELFQSKQGRNPHREKYDELRDARHKKDLAEARLYEKELAVLAESSSTLIGNPWTFDLAGLTLKEAFNRGFPVPEHAFGWDATAIANDDSARNHVVMTSRILYDQNPHAKGIVKNAASFVCGAKCWEVESTPRMPRPDASTVRPLKESAVDQHDSDPLFVRTVGDDITPVDPNLSIPNKAPEGGKVEARMPVDEALSAVVRERWRRYIRRGVFHPKMSWAEFWKEAYIRVMRDGEVFIYLGNDKGDGRLTPRMWDPRDVQHPRKVSTNSHPSSVFDPDAHGIRVDEEDEDTVLGYWYRPHNRREVVDPVFVDADRVIHIKTGTDANVKRGIPVLYLLREYLRHYDKWLEQSLRHQRVQTSIAILRKWTNSTPAQVKRFLKEKAETEVSRTTQAGNERTVRTMPQLPIVDAPAGMELEMATPNGRFADSNVLARNVKLGMAVGVGQSETMVSADASNANYASSRVAQFIALRNFESEQGEWTGRITDFYEKWYYTEVAMDRLPAVIDECQLDANITPSALPNWEAELAAESAVRLKESGIIDQKTAQELVRVDPEVVGARMEEEQTAAVADEKEMKEMFGVQDEDAELDAELEAMGNGEEEEDLELELEEDPEEEETEEDENGNGKGPGILGGQNRVKALQR